MFRRKSANAFELLLKTGVTPQTPSLDAHTVEMLAPFIESETEKHTELVS